jgi:SAM-dependent methyltransferase
VSVIWHDLECGSYTADLTLWRSLATREGDPILEIGGGTGRVALDLARRGHRVTALDIDAVLLDELRRRSERLELTTACADARSFELGARFALCLVPMQTIQLLGGRRGRASFLGRARHHLRPGGLLAAAISDSLEAYDIDHGSPAPVPDMCECDGVVYASQPTAIRSDNGRTVLERRREIVRADGGREVERHSIGLDRLTIEMLEAELTAAGFTLASRETIAPTPDYADSEVVIARA